MRADAQAWIDADPDPVTRAELAAIAADDPDAIDRLFATHLDFGTAGIRGQFGPGPGRMNRLLARNVARGLATVLTSYVVGHTEQRVVVGYDARYQSDEFALDIARVMAAEGFAVTVLAGPNPTPLLAFAIGHLDAVAGVMVTASHNPPDDNGIKVYWSDGVQIAPPVDQEIADAIAQDELVREGDLAAEDDPQISWGSRALVDAYVAATLQVIGDRSARNLDAVYTPLHGVGAALVRRVFAAAGFEPPTVVDEQVVPDPDFPTTPFPNPEEPGTLDPAIDLAIRSNADIVFANDPDADRLAVAVPDGATWRRLNGNEIGVLLADHLLRSGSGPDRLVATTVVSSRMLEQLADHHGVHYAETLTGFKWLMRPALAHPDYEFVLGYEEALGYAGGVDVRDKDGIRAMLAFAELAAELKAADETVLDRLYSLYATVGVHRTGQIAIRHSGAAGLDRIRTVMADLRTWPPGHVAESSVSSIEDLLEPTEPGKVPTNALVFTFDELHDHGCQARIVVRPSGTEPKLKLYGEVIATLSSEDANSPEAVASAATEGDELVDRLLVEFARVIESNG